MAKRSTILVPNTDDVDPKHNDEQTDEQVQAREVAKPKKETPFANLTNPTQGTQGTSSILFNNTGVSIPPPTNLFATASTPTTNLFSGVSSIFGNATGGLFSNTATSIFSNNNAQQPGLFQTIQGAPKGSDDEDDGEDVEDPKSDDEANKEIIMKFEYKKATTQLHKYPLLKFRRNTNNVLEKGSISIEKVNDQDSHVIIYRNNIQSPLYQGLVFKGISKVSPLNQKKENLVVRTVSKAEKSDSETTQKEQSEGNNKSFSVDTIKLMFEFAEDADKFSEEFKKLIGV